MIKIQVRFLLLIGLISLILFSSSQGVSAYGRNSYFDWGPYYGQQKVLGLKAYAQEPLPNIALPQGVVIPQPSIAPDNFFYGFKGFAETIQSSFTFDAVSKQELNLNFANERLAEINYLLSKGETDEANKISQRYASLTNQISTETKTLKERGIDVGPIVTKLGEQASAHEIIAENLATNAGPITREVVQTVIESSQSSLDRTADISGQQPIPENLSQSLQDLKKQGLLSTEESNKIYSLKTREEVRNELNRLNEGGLFPVSELKNLDQQIRDSYPDHFQKTLENLRYSELRGYENIPTPDEDTVKKLEDFRNNYQEGTPLPQELKPYVVFNRIRDLTQTINLSSLDPSKERELATFYPSYITPNPTYNATRSAQAATPSATVDQSNISTPPAESASPYISAPEGFLPDSPFYFIKSITEGFGNMPIFDITGRLSSQLDRAEERLREASALLTSGKNKSGLISLKNYQEQFEDVSDQIKSLPASPEQRLLANKLEQAASRHNILLEKSVLPIPEEGREILGSAIKATQKAFDAAADALEKPVVPPLLLDRLGSLQQQGMLLSEEVSNVINSASREEVREKISALEEKGAIPPADAKKLDEKQFILYPDDYNKLIEARKIEELQRLRQVQTDIAQTSTLKQNKDGTEAKVTNLLKEIDLSVLSPQDITGNQTLFDKFNSLVATFSASPSATPNQTGDNATASSTALFNVGTPSANVTPFSPPNTGFLPDNTFYFLKGALDTFRLTTSFGPQAQLRTRLSLAQEKLNEAYVYIDQGADKKAADLFQNYITQMQAINLELSGNNIPEDVRQAFSSELDSAIAQQKNFLERLAVRTGEHTSGPIGAAIVEITKALDKTADLREEDPIPANLVEKLNSIPGDMVPKETIQSLLESPNREDARNNIATLSAIGAISPTELKAFDEKISELDSEEVGKLEQIKKVADIVKSQDTVTDLEKTISKNEDIVKKLGEFQQNFKPGDDIPEDLRPYIPLSRLDELQKTIRPDLISFGDFPNRNDIILSVATLREEFRPTKDDVDKITKFKKDNPNLSLPPLLARLEAFVLSLGVRADAGPCYLPSPPFPANTPCPPPGSPIPVAPIGGSGQGGQTNVGTLTYGQGPNPVSYGFCPNGYHWMYDSGGWCMSNNGSYNSFQNYSYVYNNANNYAQNYGLGAPAQTSNQGSLNRNDYSGYLANTVINSPTSSYTYQAGSYGSSSPYTSNYYGGSSPTYNYTNSSSSTPYPNYSSYSLPPGYPGPALVSPGVCPEGYHFMGDNGGWCMSNGGVSTNYNQYQSVSNSNGTSVSNYPPTYYGPAPSTYQTDQYGYSQANSPRPIYSGVCPEGYHWMGDSGGWCMSNGSAGSPDNVYGGGGSTQVTPCTGAEYFRSGLGCVKTVSPYGYCDAGWSWVGGGECVRAGSANRGYDSACGGNYYRNTIGEPCKVRTTSGTSPGSCPAPEYWKDGTDCVKPSSPYGYCDANWYWVGDSCARVGSAFGGYTSACGGGYTRTSSTQPCIPGSSPYPSSSTSPTPVGTCTSSETWRDYAGCVKPSSPYGYCEAGWSWVGGDCARVGSANRSYDAACGPGYSRNSTNDPCVIWTTGTSSSGSQCPPGWHWMSDTGGWCMADGGNSGPPPTWNKPICANGQNWNGSNCNGWGTTSSPSPSPSPSSSPSPSPSASTGTTYPTCPDGYHYMGANYSPSGDCMSNSDSSVFSFSSP
ncbi:MAG: hypothetical protein A3J50_03845 [Candidatus Woykebacteria bacterium RIFCSPHIGHO2_02_FULL_43_16b]|uniref:DUF5667 domain-containing protein n=1 Tax=Candidatus Woykebacteria bacterium RIFCSPHIGHO2_02_FULL_43_16b TaxID=1802601 RepID=A0A1G1WMS1_9BACT|nr:MAG: hypothetical protein A3J50_03845 [Candidatus Woykebacteria bacterium RIFCSPHIGHO2_02_FULL_43_16b]